MQKPQFDPNHVRIGITPTGWTNDDMPLLGNGTPYEQILSEAALAGFSGTSIGHNYPMDDPDLLREELSLRGLELSEPWTSTFFTTKQMREQTLASFEKQLEFMHRMGSREIVVAELGHAVHQQDVAVLPNKPVFEDSQWKALCEGLNDLGKIAQTKDMVMSYHHHVGTGVQTRDEVDRLMANTDPDLVHLLVDTGHMVYGGGDPLELIKTYGARIRHAHLKNIRESVLRESIREGRPFLNSVLAGVFTVPGDPEGAIDFVPILQALADRNYHGWLVVEAEQDPAKAHPLKYAKMARAYLRDVIGF
jgi:inosose dehydratase